MLVLLGLVKRDEKSLGFKNKVLHFYFNDCSIAAIHKWVWVVVGLTDSFRGMGHGKSLQSSNSWSTLQGLDQR